MGPRGQRTRSKGKKESPAKPADMPSDKPASSESMESTDDQPLTRKVIYDIVNELFEKHYAKTKEELNKTISTLEARIDAVTRIA